MKKSLTFIITALGLSCLCISSYAQTDGAGQLIQIQTRLHSFVGKPSLLLVIRDLDHNENIPYVFDMRRGENSWIATTGGRNYLITAAEMQIETYLPKENRFRKYKIHNFCHLESRGRIQKGVTLNVTVTGDLSLNTNSYQCSIQRY